MFSNKRVYCPVCQKRNQVLGKKLNDIEKIGSALSLMGLKCSKCNTTLKYIF